MKLGLADILTYRCNSRCAHCHIWKKKSAVRELSLAEHKKLYGEILNGKIESLSISGGEPFMRPDVEAVLRSVPSEVPLMVGSNGILSERIVRSLDRIRCSRPISVQLSLDGMEETHDRVRGVSGNFRKVVEILRWCQCEDVPSTVSFTLGADNWGDLLQVAHLSESLGAHFTFRPVNRGDFYDNLGDDFQSSRFSVEALAGAEQQVMEFIRKKLKKGYYMPTDIVFWGYSVDYLRGVAEIPRCYAGEGFFLIDPSGDVYPCPQYWLPMGNAMQWNEWSGSPGHREIIEKVKRLDCGGCWNDCFIWNSLRKQPEWVRRKHDELIDTKLGVPDDLLDKIMPGDSGSVRYLGAGWHELESPEFRWTSGESSLYLKGSDSFRMTIVNGCPEEGSSPQRLTVLVSGDIVECVEVDSCGEKTVSITVPDSLIDEKMKITLRCDRTWQPSNVGLSDDQRELGLAVKVIERNIKQG